MRLTQRLCGILLFTSPLIFLLIIHYYEPAEYYSKVFFEFFGVDTSTRDGLLPSDMIMLAIVVPPTSIFAHYGLNLILSGTLFDYRPRFCN